MPRLGSGPSSWKCRPRLEAFDNVRSRIYGRRVERQRDDIREGRDVSAAVGVREDFNRHVSAALRLIFEEQRVGGADVPMREP